MMMRLQQHCSSSSSTANVNLFTFILCFRIATAIFFASALSSSTNSHHSKNTGSQKRSTTGSTCSNNNSLSSSNNNHFKVTPCTRICRYNSNFYNGQVCIGCFRDTTEIAAWSSMTNLEKNMALEDAVDRCENNCSTDESANNSSSSNKNVFEASIDSNELKKQAQAWLDLSRQKSVSNEGVNVFSTNNQYQWRTPTDSVVVDDSPDKKVRNNNVQQNYILDNRSKLVQESIVVDEQWPNMNIMCQEGSCTFDFNFCDGQVCRKCFRDHFEITNWDQFTQNQRKIAFIDISDRRRDNSQHDVEEYIKYDWKEIAIGAMEISNCFETFLEGNSVLTLSSILDEDNNICNDIANRVSNAAKSHRRERVAMGLPDEGIVRLPSIDAAERANINNTSCAQPIDSKTDALVREILLQTCNIIDDEASSLVTSLFDSDSLTELYQLDCLTYASREPAINVYTKGGKFLAHEDGQQMTILIPLTSPDEFGGGGTAFWSQESRGHRVDPPSLVLKPEKGTAILFGGHVTHAGLPIEWGERIVLVASFSKKRK